MLSHNLTVDFLPHLFAIDWAFHSDETKIRMNYIEYNELRVFVILFNDKCDVFFFVVAFFRLSICNDVDEDDGLSNFASF